MKWAPEGRLSHMVAGSSAQLLSLKAADLLVECGCHLSSASAVHEERVKC